MAVKIISIDLAYKSNVAGFFYDKRTRLNED